MYERDALRGGHVIMLGGGCEEAALAAVRCDTALLPDLAHRIRSTNLAAKS